MIGAPGRRHPAGLPLLPRPRHVELTGRRVPDRPPTAVRVVTDARLGREGYELRIDDGAVTIVAGDAPGLAYGRATLAQLRHLAARRSGPSERGTLPAGTIRDHPDLPVRGVMLDVSRDKVPTIATLEATIDRLAAWKVNHVELYSEHTFAYRDHPEVHAAASPYTAGEMAALDRFCAARHVELTPNQNSLGHMNRWLAHDRYRPLALAPAGFVDPDGFFRAPMTLDPRQPGSFALVRELLAELLPLFSSRRVHVGLDETWEMPPERLGELMEWMARLRGLPELDGREMLVWGDMLAGRGDLIARVPDGVTVCEWGYEATHPFDARAGALAGAGVPFWLAPGTSSWLSILGRLTNALRNCRAAAEAALGHGASGLLVTDWGDCGHLQPPAVSTPALAYGAALSWCASANADLDLAAVQSAHAFDDPTGELAGALGALGDAHLALSAQRDNEATSVLHLYYPQLTVGRGPTDGVTAAEFETLAGIVDGARARLRRARPGCADGDLVLRELEWAADLVSLAARDACARLAGDGTISSVPAAGRHELAAALDGLIALHGELWLARNRPGGLDDSARWLRNLRSSYLTGRPDPAWGGWKVARTG